VMQAGALRIGWVIMAPLLSVSLGIAATRPHDLRLLVAIAIAIAAVALVQQRPVVAMALGVFVMALPYTWNPMIPKLGAPASALIPLAFLAAFGRRDASLRLCPLDIVVVVFAQTPFVIAAVQGQPLHLTQALAVGILLPYFGFRVILSNQAARKRFPGLIIAVGVATALYGIVETVTGDSWLLELYNNSSYGVWGRDRERLGLLRAQSTFGHAIAFGTFLLIPLAYAGVRRGKRHLVAVGVILVAELVTFSRGPWIAAAVALVLLARVRRRIAVFVVAAGVVLVVVSPLQRLILESGSVSTEAGHNANYRFGLLGAAIDHMSFFGRPFVDLATAIPDFPDVTSLLASTIVTTGLVGLVELIVIGVIIVRLYGRQSHASDPAGHGAAVAVLVQLVSLIAVTLITSYQYFFWASLAYLASTAYGHGRNPNSTADDLVAVRHGM
jgi:hypothetical protein